MNYARALIKVARDNGQTEEEAVEYVLDSFTLEEYREYTKPFLTDEVRRLYRERVRQLEREYRAASTTPGYDATLERRTLLTETFALPDGSRVPWGEATAAQHMARADWMRRKAAAHTADAEGHEAAARRILAAGVTCLDDLDEAAA